MLGESVHGVNAVDDQVVPIARDVNSRRAIYFNVESTFNRFDLDRVPPIERESETVKPRSEVCGGGRNADA